LGFVGSCGENLEALDGELVGFVGFTLLMVGRCSFPAVAAAVASLRVDLAWEMGGSLGLGIVFGFGFGYGMVWLVL
jgi:hypothetical protein